MGLRLNGFAALKAIDDRLYQAVVKLTSCNRTHVKHTLKGVETGSTTSPVVQGNKPTVEQMDAAAAGAVGALGAGWAELRNALAQFVPENAICLNKKFSSIEQHTDYVKLHFTDGTSVQARLVIGADGSFSKVRQQTVADGPPIFSGTVFWRARLTSTTLPKDEAHVFLPAPNSNDNVTGVIYPIGGENQHVWTTSASAARMQQAGVPMKATDKKYKDNVIDTAQPSNQASCADRSTQATYLDDKQKENEPQQLGIRERCKTAWGDNAAVVLDTMDATDESSILEHSLYIRPPEGLGEGHWGVGRVTLVGDAAHPMRPIAGQGVNQALEDAVVLAKSVRDGGLTASSLRAYEAARIPRLQEIAAFQIVSGMKLYGNRPQELPENLQGYKHAAAEWNGSAIGAFNEWLMDRQFAPLSSCKEE